MGIHIKASKKNLQEATALSLRGKLNEVYTKEYIATFDELYDSSWGSALQVLDKISEADLEDNLMDWLEDLGTEDNPIDRTELNDYIIFQDYDIYDALGLDENGDPIDDEDEEDLDESKKQEARNPENDDINDKIRKTIHGSKRYEDELKEKGLKVYRGTPVTVAGPKGSIDSSDLKTAPADMDLYNYMTKDRVEPEETSRGMYISDTNPFSNTVGKNDPNIREYDKNNISKAIPKKYKTGINPKSKRDFPNTSISYTAVASYEPLRNKNLDDFKDNKEALKVRDKKIADIEADYAEEDAKVKSVRNRIAKSKENVAKAQKQEARSHKEDNEKVAPRNDKDIFGNNMNNFRKNTFHTTNTSILDKNDLAKRYKTGKKDYTDNDEYVIPNDEYTDITNRYKYARQSAKDFAKDVDYYENEIKAGNSVNKNSLTTVRGLRNKSSKEANDILKQMRNKTKNTEARSHKEDNEKVAPRTSIEKEYMNNNANFGIYSAEKFNQDSYKEPINAKRNKIRNYKDTGTITHTSYEKSPNKQTQLYKNLKDLDYIKSNKKVNEGIFNKKQKDKKQSTILDDHPELVDLFKTKDMSRLGRAGWEPSKQEKIERHKTEAKLVEDDYISGLKAVIKDDKGLNEVKNWINDVERLVEDLDERYTDMYIDVREAIDNLFSGSTPSGYISGLSNAIRDVKEELNNIKFN